MTIAVISDIHANLPALEAVLRDIEKRKADAILCLGDIIGKGPSTRETVDLCRSSCALVLRGNWDWFVFQDYLNKTQGKPMEHSGVNEWYIQSAGEERMEYLGSLPHSTERILGGKLTRLFHAHPLNFNRYFAESPVEQRLELFEPPDASENRGLSDIALYGDIHYAYMQIIETRHLASNRQLINVGSVGNPLDIPEASYVMLDGDGDGESAGVNFIRVPYDIDKAIELAKAAGSPHLEGYISELRTAEYFRRG